MEFGIFTELSLIIVLAAVIAGIMRFLRQPVIIGYLITGLLVGPLLFDLVRSKATLDLFAELGIALLLFMVGIHLSPRVIQEVGKVSVVTGLGQIVFTALFGFIITRAFGIEVVPALYIALALTFSSTIIILKLLSDKRDLERPYGKISVGFLIVQDIVAALLLIVVSSFAGGSGLVEVAVETVVRGAFLAAIMILVGVSILPRLGNFFARSQELLFLFSIAWGLGLATLFGALGFSIEIGALVAGVALSTSPYSVQVAARLRPLRDFFIIIFFILLGTQFVLGGIGGLLVLAVVLSLFVLIGNPIIVMILMGALGFGRRVGFQAGLTVAQVSEFSFVLVLLGSRLGHIDDSVISLVTIVGLITIAGSTYMIMYADKLYTFLSPILRIFERRATREDIVLEESKPELVLFGINRIGHDFLKVFKKRRQKPMVIDFNPRVVSWLSQEGVDVRYGDADDKEFLDTLPLGSAKMVISTIPEFETNMLLISYLKKVSKHAIVIVINHDIGETLRLYEAGASYVILPHFLGGRYAARLVKDFHFDTKRFARERQAHIKDLELRRHLGHEHPVRENER